MGESGIESGSIRHVPVPRRNFPLELARIFH